MTVVFEQVSFSEILVVVVKSWKPVMCLIDDVLCICINLMKPGDYFTYHHV